MMSFRNGRLQEVQLPAETICLMAEIAESKSLPQLYEKRNSQLLRALRAAAFLRSVESSNRADGITVEPHRLPISSFRTRPSHAIGRKKKSRVMRARLTLFISKAPIAHVTPR